MEVFKKSEFLCNLIKMQKKVTLSLDSETYSEFQKFCEENDIMLSKRIERLIKKHLEENKQKEGGK